MRRISLLFALFAVVLLAPAPRGQAGPSSPTGDHCRSLDASRMAVSDGPPDTGSVHHQESIEAAAGELWIWVRTRTGLTQGEPPPPVVLVTERCLRALRQTAGSDALGVEAVYSPSSGEVFLRGRWRADSLAARSILVHEFAHHAQALSGRRFACAAQAEKEAFALQADWLAQYGLTLEGVFGIDRLTLVVLTECGM